MVVLLGSQLCFLSSLLGSQGVRLRVSHASSGCGLAVRLGMSSSKLSRKVCFLAGELRVAILERLVLPLKSGAFTFRTCIGTVSRGQVGCVLRGSTAKVGEFPLVASSLVFKCDDACLRTT